MTAPVRPPKRRRPRPRISPELRALRRAARVAYRLSVETGTPFYVWKDGRVVDLLAKKAPAKRRRKPGSGTGAALRKNKKVKRFASSR